MTYAYALDAALPATLDEARALVGGKAANLGVMARDLGLPVPPGFVITTETCRTFLAERLAGRSRRRAAGPDGARSRRPSGAASATRRPAARQRALRRARLDARDDGHDPQPRPERRDDRRSRAGHRRRGVRPALPRALRRELPVDRRRRRRPGGPVAPAAAGDRGRLPVLEQRPGPGLSAEGGDPRRSRDGGDRPGDGLRQSRRDLGDRRRCSPATRRPASRRSTAT